MDSVKRLPTKQNNRKTILDLFRKSEVLSVAEINRVTDISKPTVQKVINHFAEAGYIQAEGKGESTEEGGKKPQLYSFNSDNGYIICIHLGPDFLYTAVTDLSVEIIHSEYTGIEALSIEELVSSCAETAEAFYKSESAAGSRLVSINIALPGIVNPESGSMIFIPHFPDFGYNYPFLERLKERLEDAGIPSDVPIYCDNINRFQAFGEMQTGKAKGISNFMIIDAMVEGLGSGIVVKGKLKHGSQNFSGEVGHMVLMPYDGPECICGGRGCFEALVNLKRVEVLIENGREEHPYSLLFRDGNDEELLSGLCRAFAVNDALAVDVVDELAFWFASGINNIVMINDPELIILEGIYNALGERFIGMIKQHLGKLVYPGITRTVRIEFSEFGRERGIIGAGTHAVWSLFNDSAFYDD